METTLDRFGGTLFSLPHLPIGFPYLPPCPAELHPDGCLLHPQPLGYHAVRLASHVVPFEDFLLQGRELSLYQFLYNTKGIDVFRLGWWLRYLHLCRTNLGVSALTSQVANQPTAHTCVEQSLRFPLIGRAVAPRPKLEKGFTECILRRMREAVSQPLLQLLVGCYQEVSTHVGSFLYNAKDDVL